MKTGQRTVLVTGASSGIGEATARVLVGAGWRVFAGVRHLSGAPGTLGIEPVVLEVTSAESIEAARAEIEGKLAGAGLDALVNNAGIGQVAPTEHADFRGVFEVNVFGLIAVTQAFLPLLRQARGRIVNLSSVGGVITIPFGGALCASKHAVEAITDALRMELLPAGIDVIAIRPASIHTPSAGKLEVETKKWLASLPPSGREHYEASIQKFIPRMIEQENAGSPPEVVGEAILKALEAKKPAPHYFVGKDAAVFQLLTHIPEHLRDHLILQKLGLPEHPAE